jgi:GT2 family glycosyltransferase
MKHAFHEQGADFVMVWENDTLPMEGYFNSLQHIVENWDGRTVICSKLYYSHQPDHIFGMGGTFDPRSGKKTLIGRTQKDGPEFQQDREVDIFLGIGFMVHRSLVEEIGYLDEVKFPHYHADFDYGLRVKEKGFRNVVFHELRMLNDMETTGITHKKNKSLKDFWASLTSIKSSRNVRRNLLFYRRHTTSILAYSALLSVYLIYTASFLKWYMLGWFGVERSGDKLR